MMEDADTERTQLVSSPSCSSVSPENFSSSRRLRRLVLPSLAHNAFPTSPATPSSVFSFDIPNSPGYGVRARTPRTPGPRTPMTAPVSRTPAGGSRTPKHFSFENPNSEVVSSKYLLRSISEVEVVDTPTSIFNFEFPLAQQSVTVITQRVEDENGNEEEKGDGLTVEVVTSTCDVAPKTDWHNILLIALVNFLVRMQFTVYFASLWPFLQEIDSTATPTFYAYMGAVYSLGVAISAPLFGYWSNKIGQIRRPAVVALWMMMFSNLLYLAIDYFPDNRKYVMMFARLNVGIAAGAASILNIYWTYASQLKDRSTAAAVSDGAFCLGTALGPLFQLAFSPLGYPGIQFQFISINMYTLPAVCGIVLISVAMCILVFFFKEMEISHVQLANGKRDSIESEFSFVVPNYDVIAIGICIMLKCLQMFIYANIETIGSPFTEWMFGLTRAETTQFNSSLVTLSGFLGFAFLLGYVWTKIGKRLDNRVGLLIGVAFTVAFLATTFPWWMYSEKITSEACTYSWCSSTAKISKMAYSIAYVVLFGVGFPLLNVHLAAMYSQILGPRRQGTMHGVNTLISSLSRIAGPVIVTEIFTGQGPRMVWFVQLIVILLTLIPVGFFFHRLVPLKALNELKCGEKLKHKDGVVYRF